MVAITRTLQAELEEQSPLSLSQDAADLSASDASPLTRYFYHDSFASPEAEDTYFGAQVEAALSRSIFSTAGEDGKAKRLANLEALKETLFLRYNYARYRLSLLLSSQQGLDAARMGEAALWQRNVLRARADLVNANIGLVVAMAKRARIRELDFEDLISQGNLALLRSVESFDFSRGYKFSTYACRSILRSFSRLAAETSRQRQRFSTSAYVDPDLCCPPSHNHDKAWEDAVDDIKEILTQNLATLSETEKTIILDRYAIPSGGKGKTLTEIGEVVGVSYERVRQIHNSALLKIRLAMTTLRSGRSTALANRAG